MEIRININDNVSFVPTKEGLKVLTDSAERYLLRKEDKGSITMQLHTFMNIFGDKVYNGSTLLFKNNTLIFDILLEYPSYLICE